MKAVVYEKYGPPEVLKIKEVEKPTPKDDEVLIKNYSTTVHVGDTRMRGFRVPKKHWLLMRLFLGITKPKRQILGMEVSGVIESVGKNVKDFKKGDAVFALTGFGGGGYAEYSSVPAINGDEKKGMVVSKPSNISFEEAAAVPAGALTALLHIQKVDVQKGKKILIYGASGSVGTYAVQIAKYYGGEVTGVCSTSNLELVKSIGAEKVIDYTKKDFTKNGEVYDIVFDAVFKISKSKCKNILKENGIFDSSHAKIPEPKTKDLIFIKELIEKNKLKPVIDRTYKMEQIVEGHRYVDKGHKKGNVVVKI
ncbi:MAG: NADPH:quinone reductase [Thermoplasmatales archaeon SG8-52-3]|nr:MAG: NADPH:quinone reductase [Thermoplasmatales archaeon SG8-52-3]